MGFFGDHRRLYTDRDLAILPVKGKSPPVNGWNKYLKSLPTEVDYERWDNWDALTGMSLIFGPKTGIIGIDIDTDDAEIQYKIERNLPTMVLGKRGKKGYTSFYRYDFSVAPKRAYLKLRHKGIDVGEVLYATHSVLPPSLHPDGGSYHWLDGLDDLDSFSELPVITHENIYNILSDLGNQSAKTDGSRQAGRNNLLKDYVTKLIKGNRPYYPAEAAKLLLEYDKAMHDNPLFEDLTESGNGSDPFTNAVRFYTSIAASIVTGDDVTEKQDNFKYKSKSDGFYEHNGKRSIPKYFDLADYMVNEKNYYYDSDHMIYNGKFYDELKDVEIGHLINELTQRQCVLRAQKTYFTDVLKEQGFEAQKQLVKPDGFLNLKNGVLDIRKKELLPHSHKYKFNHVLDTEYNPDASCTRFLEFLSSVFTNRNGIVDEESIFTVQQYLAYTLWGGDPFIERALCLYGEGRNGKSTLIDVISALLGTENISHVSLGALDNPNSVINMEGKVANMVEETPNTRMSSETVKNVISGGKVRAKKLYHNERLITVKTRIWFACNELPKFSDTTIALVDRLIFLEFPRYYRESERDGTLKEQLRGELPGILNWALELLPLNPSTFKVVEPKSGTKIRDKFILQSNSVYAFLNEVVEVTGKEFDRADYSDLMRSYKYFCQENNLMAYGKIKFLEKFRQLLRREELPEEFLVSRDKNSRFFRGVALFQSWA